MNLPDSWLVRVAAAVLFAAAVACACWALWGDRPKGRKRCRKCWYTLPPEAGASTRCPECGYTALRDSDVLRTRRRWALLALGLLIAVAASVPMVGKGRLRRAMLWFMPTWRTVERHEVAGYSVIKLEANDDQRLPPRMIEVRHLGQVVWRMTGFHPQIGGAFASGKAGPGAGVVRAGIGQDVTGDGRPDLIVEDPNPGTGNIAVQYVFTLVRNPEGPSLPPIAVIPYSGLWRDVDNDAVPEFEAADRTFSYWWTTGAGSPYPSVILKWRGDHFAVAPDLMRRPAPSREALQTIAVNDRGLITATGADGCAPALARALTFIYEGNSGAALDYLRLVWDNLRESGAAKQTGATEADGAFAKIMERLKESPFGAEVLGMQP